MSAAERIRAALATMTPGELCNDAAALLAERDALLEALQDTSRRIEASDVWWMTCPDRGGLDADMIEAAIAKATGQ